MNIIRKQEKIQLQVVRGGGSAFDVNNELICNSMSGVWDNGNCKCGSVIMTEYSQQCENGQIVKQKITKQTLNPIQFKL